MKKLIVSLIAIASFSSFANASQTNQELGKCAAYAEMAGIEVNKDKMASRMDLSGGALLARDQVMYNKGFFTGIIVTRVLRDIADKKENAVKAKSLATELFNTSNCKAWTQ